MDSLRDQLARNLAAMARELARDPSADQREWLAMAGEVFGFEVTRIVTSPGPGDVDCRRYSSTEQQCDQKRQFGVTKFVSGLN